MNERDRKSLPILPIVILIGAGVGFAGSQGGARVGGVPLFLLLVGLAFLINWIAYVPAYRRQTERFYDLTGSITYVTVTLLALLLAPDRDARALLLAALVIIWSVRLGSFLYRRIHRDGKDGRFDDIKPSWIRFLNAWTIQGLWVIFTAAAALVAITTTARQALGLPALLGLLIWLLGFGIEVVADRQKSRFRADPANKGRFIQSGLWARSRHPNYFGEILLWIGVAIIAAPVLQGWQWVAMISPLFVTFLLTRVSGVPMLEKRADERWGGEPDYEAYKAQTPVLIPRLW